MHAPNADALFHRFGYAPLRSTRNDLFHALGYAALGAVAGAIVVALVTPKSGPQLRSSISATAGQLKARTTQGRFGTKVRETAEQLRDAVDEHVDHV